MNRLAIAFGLMFSLGACGGGSGIEKEMSEWKNKVCACKDAECAEKTFTDYRAWTKTKRDEAKKMDKSDLDKLEKIEDELKDCRRKLRDAAAPPAGDAPATGDTPPAGDPPTP